MKLHVLASLTLLGAAGPAAGTQATQEALQSPHYPFPCAPALADQAGGGCITASSAPALGELYPLSQDLFVDGSGRVGIGTLAPDARLTVIGDERVRGDLRFDRDVDGIVFGNQSAFPQLVTPMITMFPSGTSNVQRMVLGHSPSFPYWGLEYRDQQDVFVFRGSKDVFAIDLGTERVAIGHTAPAADLHIARTGSSSLVIEADTDDFGEGDQPSLGFLQDGGITKTWLGFFDGTDAFTLRNLNNKDVVFDFGASGSSGSATTANWVFKNISYNFLSQSYVQNVRARLTAAGDLQLDGSVSTPAADVAEVYPAADGVEPGDVVAFGGAGLTLVPARAGGPPPAGIVSSRPGFLLGLSYTDEDLAGERPPEPDPDAAPAADGVDASVRHELLVNHRAPLALAGRVPCKVSAENGPVRAGDLLTVASIPGHAARARARGAVVGTALEPLEGERGTILVFVRAGWIGGGDAGSESELADLRREVTAIRSELAALRRAAGAGAR